MVDTIRKLARRMQTSRTIAFVGAGASAAAGYPTWNQLIDGLYARADALLDMKRREEFRDLRWLAELYSADLEGSLVDAVREVFEEFSPSGPGGLHRQLARLPFRHFITTNYDKLIEDACDAELAAERDHELYPGERESGARDVRALAVRGCGQVELYRVEQPETPTVHPTAYLGDTSALLGER